MDSKKAIWKPGAEHTMLCMYKADPQFFKANIFLLLFYNSIGLFTNVVPTPDV